MKADHRKPKNRLKWLIERGHIGPEYESLGDKIILLAERKVSEPSPHMDFGVGSGGGGEGGGGALKRAIAHQRWDRLMGRIGPRGEALISTIIVDGLTFDEAAKALNIHPKAILPLLQDTLEILGRAA